MYDILKAALLGILEGFTEFIPVSSTGHLIVAGQLLEFSGEFAKTFDIAIQMGAIFAVIIVYRDKFREYVKFKPNLAVFPNIIHVILTTIPALIAGYFLHGVIKRYLFSSFTVAIGLIMGSFVMLMADYIGRRRKNNTGPFTYKSSLLIGFFQCLSLWPGMSRSGATISGGIFGGLDHKKAASYSFICAVPVMLCATGYEFIKTSASFTPYNLFLVSVGFLMSFLLGWLSVVFFLKLIPRIKLLPFAVYRIVLALIILNSSLGAKVAIIQSPDKDIAVTRGVSLERTFPHAATGTFLHLVSYNSEPDILEALVNPQRDRILELDNMYIQIKKLPSFLCLGAGQRKKTLSEIIVGGEKAYRMIGPVTDSASGMNGYLDKLGIDRTNGRIYMEFVLDGKKGTGVLWSYEYDIDAGTVTLLKSPEDLIFS
ncbi:MAG: undecaprenyl-diphosphate phosphatase [Oligoflexia bacterium]|nr:undecaprenyl-diphosphate phosphatase [Oligoflexia bacterium]